MKVSNIAGVLNTRGNGEFLLIRDCYLPKMELAMANDWDQQQPDYNAFRGTAQIADATIYTQFH